MQWQWRQFQKLTPLELYSLLELRQRIFVVEQSCIYLDCDGLDEKCWHLLGQDEGQLLAYARILPAGLKYAEPSFGRVVTATQIRGHGIGQELTKRALEKIGELWGNPPVRISAQAHLEKFYGQFGFVSRGESYLEDNIPHIEMLRA